MTMPDLICSEIQLVEDLVDLKVISLDLGRIATLMHPQDAVCDWNPVVRARRIALLSELSQNVSVVPDAQEDLLTVIAAGDAADQVAPYVLEDLLPAVAASDAADQSEANEAAPLYITDELIYDDPSNDGDKDDAPSEAKSDDGEETKNDDAEEANEVDTNEAEEASVAVSNSFFNELFPTETVTPKVHLPGSFPDIADFEGGVEPVGSGFSGLVFKSKLHGINVVLKVSKRKSAEANRADYQEWSVSERLKRHPNVLQMIGLCPSFKHTHFPGVGTTAIISPWQENGALRAFYDKESRTRKDDDLENAALGMIRGIRSLHEQGVVHRDIAVRNFLVDIDGRVMLCDFGLTKFIPEGEKCIDTNKRPDGMLLPWQYLAPESLDGIFSTKSDMWMYGIALFELVEGRTPWHAFHKPADLIKAMKAREVTLPDMNAFPPVIADIIRECLHFEAASRPTANDVAERLVRWQFRDIDLNRDENGNTILHRLASNDAGEGLNELGDMFISEKPVMINALNHLGETPLMLASGSAMLYLFQFEGMTLGNEEPSRKPECFHNIDVFGTLVKLTERQDVEKIKLIGDNIYFKEQASKHGGGANSETPLHIAAKVGNVALFDALVGLLTFDAWKVNEKGRTALHVASQNGHVEIMEKLLSLRGDSNDKRGDESEYINLQDKTGKTALHLAAASGISSATRLLLNDTATDVNLCDVHERSPIFDAVESMQEDVLQEFVQHASVDVNKKDLMNETVLHHLARKDLPQLAQILFQRSDLKVSEQEKEHQYMPVHLAVREQSFGMADSLVSREDVDINSTDKHGNTLFHILAALSISSYNSASKRPLSEDNVSLSFAKSLVSRGVIDLNMPNSRGDTPLHVATQNNNLVILEVLLAKPSDIINVNASNKANEKALHLAAEGNKAEAVMLLLARADIDVNAENKYHHTPLHVACIRSATDVVKLLLERSDVDVNAQNAHQQTPLHIASAIDAADVAKLLLSRSNVDAGARDSHQRTPLHYTSENNAVEIATMLLSRNNVDANARNEHQQTPLHIASKSNAVEVVTILLSRNDVDASALDECHKTPLHYACCERAAKVAKLLLSRSDVEVNARDEDQRTPLHLLCMSYTGEIEVAKLLLWRSDVDVEARDCNGKTPLDIAIEQTTVSEHDEVVYEYDKTIPYMYKLTMKQRFAGLLELLRIRQFVVLESAYDHVWSRYI